MTAPVPFIGNSLSARQALTAYLAGLGNTKAYFIPGVGLTGTLNASNWADQSGNGNDLAQGTGANQPIILPWAGANYLWLPAAASNSASAPTTSVTGNFTLTFDVALDDYTPLADVTLISKLSGLNGFDVLWLTTDKIRLRIGDGATVTNVDVVAASSFTDATRHTATIVWEDGVGATFKYDGTTSGSQVAAAKTLTNAAVDFTVGSATSVGKVYDVTLTNSGATTYYSMSPGNSSETTTNTATWTGGAGETWTLANSGTKAAQIVGSPQLLLDGAAHYMKTAPFTLIQPETVYLVVKEISTTQSGKYLLDGNSINSLVIGNFDAVAAAATPPNILVYAGAAGPQDPTFATAGAYHIITAKFNGASSTLQIDGNTIRTGNCGANNAGAVTLGVIGDATSGFCNMQVKELIVRSVADTAATALAIQQRLSQIHGITL